MTMRRSFAHFGAMLKALRESFGDRAHDQNPKIPRGIKLSAAGMVESLNDENYPISPSTYSEIESGTSIPRNGTDFINAVCKVLILEPHGKEWLGLNRQLAYDVLCSRQDEQLADLVIPDAWS